MYQVNASVKGSLPFQPWAPVVLSLDGQHLRVDYGDTTTKSYDVVGCSATTTDATPFVVRVQFRNGKKLVLNMGSHALQAQLIQLLTTTSALDDTASVYDQLVGVATAITDRAALAKKSNLLPCGISVTDVQAHLRGLKDVHDHVSGLQSPLALYEWLLDTEAAYVARHRDLHGEAHPEVYAHCVYQQDPLNYALGTTSSVRLPDFKTFIGVCAFCKAEYDRGLLEIVYHGNGSWPCPRCQQQIRPDVFFKNKFGTTAFDVPMRNVLASCPQPSCHTRLPLPAIQRLHLSSGAATCTVCNLAVSYETYQIATLIREHPSIRHQSVRNADGSHTALLPTQREIPGSGLWSAYLEKTKALAQAKCDKSSSPRLEKFE
ncbi:hypothetical protein SDRG_05313 [Saprolegnia diclina VS20]|uniref:Uncharacterized protein n=1 Tax=Saprolegnia diclina (strain VS20) TaxID=1156394 RepID=T0QQS0_SAPDV|nr:hypothetical protein SDRG_05313 [Saprolegnia diclina VS20]EQC37086.1 hypothetical protein SDRG_05313 [Saprolegnia diclina VS20]|eukprot:XP_008609248.1 hypothetical protein SDRG_05313 [Saprolegnia diclina VS20]